MPFCNVKFACMFNRKITFFFLQTNQSRMLAKAVFIAVSLRLIIGQRRQLLEVAEHIITLILSNINFVLLNIGPS